jgi:hypothetical protein
MKSIYGRNGLLRKEQSPEFERLAPGMTRIECPKPRCMWYGYNHPESQGAFICATPAFPPGYFKDQEIYDAAYSDRIHGWDSDRFNRACQLAGGGDQVWSSRLPSLSPDALRRFAMEAMNTPVMPKHVRVVHRYNVSNGYSCPTIEVIYDKLAITPKEDFA